MKQTTFQHPELRDANDNIIQEGTYGKESPLVNGDNTGVLDYINNNLEALRDNINGARIYVANKDALPATGDLSAMYIAEDTGKWYLWDGSKYIETDNARKIADEAIAARDAAKASQTAAKASETAAETSENNAAASKTAAATSAGAAKTSEDNATTQANTAKAWATATTSPDGAADTASTTGKTQSAKSWAMYSENRATASATSASAAADSASAAKTSEENAANSKTAAATSATNAANSAKAAAASATAAANSAREQQADWAVTDTTSKAFIKNKPEIYPNSDKLDGYHEDSFLRFRGNASAMGEDTLWNQIGIKEYWGAVPEGITDTYKYGAVVSLPSNNFRLDVWYNHHSSEDGDGLRYRSGYTTDKKSWARLLDSNNFNLFAPTKTGTGASGTWGIDIRGTATSTLTNVTITGETSVPTANEGNSSNTIASTEFVAKSIAKLVDSSPESLNTLNELAKALGNDPNFATTVLNELGKKMDSVEAESTYATKQEAGGLSGTVMAFSGTFDEGFPVDKNTGLADKKWHLCDGTNGTPDLRNRFIYGGDGTNNGATGGEASHTLTEAELPPAEIYESVYKNKEGGPIGWLNSSDGNHVAFSTVHINGGNQPHNNMPPYYTLAYIMKL